MATLYHPLGRGAWRISQRFGENPANYAEYGLAGHEGLDFGVPVGTPVYAAHDGMAIPATGPTYGVQVWCYGAGLTSVYAHLEGVVLGNSGQDVRAGDLIGYSGNTGRSTGPHLHFGLKVAGEFVEGFRGWVDPEPYLRGETMTQIWMQCQGHNYDSWVVDHARRLGGVKLINPQYGDWRKFCDAGVPILGRMVWPEDSDKAHVADGAAGAEAWFADFWSTARQMGGITLWEGPNEPAIWDEGNAAALDAFTARLAHLFYDNGLRLVGLNFSTGHPEFGLWRCFGASLAAMPYMGRHSYTVSSPWFDAADVWHAFRLEQDVKAIRGAGFRVPPIIVGETGIDRAGGPTTDGWQARGVDANTYTTLLAQYALRLASRVPEVVVISPFVWLSTGWPSFDIYREASAQLVEKWQPVACDPAPLPDPEPPDLGLTVAERVRLAAWNLRGVPYNPDAAFAKYAREHGLGAPLTVEAYGQVEGYALQAFVGGVAYAAIGDWANVKHTDW